MWLTLASEGVLCMLNGKLSMFSCIYSSICASKLGYYDIERVVANKIIFHIGIHLICGLFFFLY